MMTEAMKYSESPKTGSSERGREWRRNNNERCVEIFHITRTNEEAKLHRRQLYYVECNFQVVVYKNIFYAITLVFNLTVQILLDTGA